MANGEYHYTESGLDFVYLADGYEFVDAPSGRHVVINDIDGLHKAIGLTIVKGHEDLSGQEIRFLRHELLLSQAGLAEILGVSDQAVRRWENGKTEIPKPAETLIRLLYLEQVGGNEKIRAVLKRIADLEDELDQKLVLTEHEGGWEPQAA